MSSNTNVIIVIVVIVIVVIVAVVVAKVGVVVIDWSPMLPRPIDYYYAITITPTMSTTYPTIEGSR